MSDQITITLTRAQAEALRSNSSQLVWYYNLLHFYSEYFEEQNTDETLSMAGAIVMEKTLGDTSKLILGLDDSLSPILKQLPSD